MKKITFLLVAMLAFCWQGHAQSTATQNFGTNGTDSAPTVLTINVGDITVNSGQPLQAVSLGTFTSHYSSPTGGTTYCGNWYAFDLAVTGGVADGTSIAAGCDADFNGLDVTGFTTITLTSNDIDAYSDTVYFDIDLDVTYLTPSCTPAVSNSETIMPDCGNLQFSIDVDIASVGDGTVITDGLGGMFTVASGLVTAGPYASGTNVTLTMEHSDPACNFSLGNFTYNCPATNDDCVDAIAIACSGQYTGDTSTANPESPDPGTCGTTSGTGGAVWYTFTGANSNDPGAAIGTIGDEVTLDLSLSTFDTKIRVFEGSCGALVCVGGDDDGGTSTRSLYTFTTTVGTDYFVLVHGYSSNEGAYTLDVSCIPPPLCTPGVATATLIEDCGASTYTIEVNVTVVGDATDITDGTTTLPFTGTQTFGPYAFGVDTTLDVVHSDGACDFTLGTYGLDACPPSNDDCANAEVAPVGLGACGTSVTGNNTGATDSGVAQAGCATATYAGGDLWYTFDMPAGETELVYTRSASVFSTTQVELYSGACGALVEEGCTTSATASFTGLTSEATYYLRIYDWGNNDIGSFTFCLNTPPTCPVPTSLNATNITVDSADLGWTENGTATAWDIEWGTNGFTPTQTPNIENTTNPHPLGGLSASTSYDYYVRADCGGGDTSPWAGPFTFTTADPPPACGENFYDDGGISSNYSNSANITTTICPDVPGDAVNVTFTFFSTENNGSTGCYDGLTIHDGPDTSAPTINPTTGTIWCWDRNDTTPNGTGDLQGMTITSTDGSGCLTFVFTSDGSVNREGWEATVGCAPLGLEDYGLTGFTYFPNPVNNTLSLRGVKDIQNVAVYNMLGQEVLRTVPNSVNSDVDMSGLQSGTYFVKVMIENTTKTIKVIKK